MNYLELNANWVLWQITHLSLLFNSNYQYYKASNVRPDCSIAVHFYTTTSVFVKNCFAEKNRKVDPWWSRVFWLCFRRTTAKKWSTVTLEKTGNQANCHLSFTHELPLKLLCPITCQKAPSFSWTDSILIIFTCTLYMFCAYLVQVVVASFFTETSVCY